MNRCLTEHIVLITGAFVIGIGIGHVTDQANISMWVVFPLLFICGIEWGILVAWYFDNKTQVTKRLQHYGPKWISKIRSK